MAPEVDEHARVHVVAPGEFHHELEWPPFSFRSRVLGGDNTDAAW
eukprot:CAMPEP_0185791476 /NCGR_PEP_ID=MMETSP1174-20130828/158397_1 /TAXON_ID=35687 /ORGANISM="Dictyocha speculum, Strain CCMP1381" /LENGTH=44 /DNA_ID= /DNA_START= /DNA_END= /DNA_ORIENTATION=